MTFYTLTRPGGPWDYPTLGFTATDGAVLDGSLCSPPLSDPPDIFWAVGGSSESGITRWGAVTSPPAPAEPNAGAVLVYDPVENRGNWVEGVDAFAPGTSLGDGLSATYGAAAQAAANGKAKFSVNDSGLFVSVDGNDSNDGLSPGLAKKTVAAAAAALPTAGWGRIALGAGLHTVSGLELKSRMQIQGMGRHTRLTTTGTNNVFQNTTGGSVTDVLIRDLAILPVDGAAFAVTGTNSLALSVFDDIYINPIGAGGRAIDATGLVDTKWRFHIETATTLTSTNPLVKLIATTANQNAIACNSFTGRATHNSSYVFHIEDATNASYAENNRIWDFNFEIPNKGAVKILTGTGNILDNCMGLDFSAAVTVPLVYLGKSASNTRTSRSNRINWQRHGGSLTAGQGYDIQLESGNTRHTTLLDCWADTGNLIVDFGGGRATAVGTDLTACTNASLVQGSTQAGMKFVREPRNVNFTAASAGAGVAFWDTTSNKLLTSDGTNWRDATGTIV